MLTRHPHTPAHLFLDNTPYFITGAIYQKRPLLADAGLKKELSGIMKENFSMAGWRLDHWVILDNHYHVLGHSRKGSDLSKIIGRVHYRSAGLIRAATGCERPVWWNYWDYCPRDEKEYVTRLNYLLNNPVKHGYVHRLHDYPFSSFHEFFDQMGRERLVKQFQDYPEYRSIEIKDDF
ncbi:hypothetical protein DENIS_2799 [Desulfonema ishimotonii]|uniref:Transposase IS200-like domain-containing protein n=1 Tax=Desulfonema ishimotonii TaxID=45657 RepID=A0A401FXY6_9BACT|nr:transposase [Desulfonema ishimotonii]GBC61837.1 hypothetical protein DENIS_2799 [Desulfonema ishimotonii]